MKIVFIMLGFLMAWGQAAAEDGALNSIYFAGFVQHAKSRPETNNGNVDFLAFSRDFKRNDWHFDTGVGTFVDTFHQRSYALFTNITHDRLRWGMVRPMLTLTCMYKGDDYDSDKMKVLCIPPVKFRIGDDDGLFANLMALPKIGNLTNGLYSLEIGYRF
jgi:hypothetical protein